MIQGVATGVGFLGAGLIFQRKPTDVRGLTTAAGAWSATAIGILAGLGAYLTAALGAVFVILDPRARPDPVHEEDPGAERDRRLDGGVRPARAAARASTASSISCVSFPVNVFCWLGW